MAINIEWRRFKQNHLSSFAHQTREIDTLAITTPAITVLGVFIIKENTCHSPTIKAKEGMRTDGEKKEHRGGQKKTWTKKKKKRKREANKTETREEKPEKKPAYPSFTFVFKTQKQ